MAIRNNKSNRKLEIEKEAKALKALTKLVNDITEELSLDEERMVKRVAAAKRSEYGQINGMINLVCSIANWPVEQGDASMIAVNQKTLEDKFDLNLMFLQDIRDHRGFHTFVTDDIEVIQGQEPDYSRYAEDCEILLDMLFELDIHKPSINQVKWERQELKAQANAQLEVERMTCAVELFNRQKAELARV